MREKLKALNEYFGSYVLSYRFPFKGGIYAGEIELKSYLVWGSIIAVLALFSL